MSQCIHYLVLAQSSLNAPEFRSGKTRSDSCWHACIIYGTVGRGTRTRLHSHTRLLVCSTHECRLFKCPLNTFSIRNSGVARNNNSFINK